jgi:hydrogenase-4 component F
MNDVLPFLIAGILLPPFLTAMASFRKATPRGLRNLTSIASLVTFVFSLILLLTFPQNGLHFLLLYIFQGNLDALSVFFIFLVNIVALFASWFTISIKSSEAGGREKSWEQDLSLNRFHVLFNLFHCSMLLVPILDNLLSIWVLVTITTVFSAPLIGFRQDRRAQEAAWKYIMISSAGIVSALLGTILLLSILNIGTTTIGTTTIDINWSGIIHALSGNPVPPYKTGIVQLAFLLILVGYGTKAGLFPMHTWVPDGHGEAPSPVSALLSGVLLKSALYVILRFYVITNLALGSSTFASEVILSFGLLSLLMATPFILKENRFKRVLAYHSLEHMGIITFGIGLGSSVAFFGALFQVLNHALTKALMFLAYGDVQAIYAEEHIPEEKIRGVFKTSPFTGTLLALGGLALVGAPPFSILFSEFIILSAAFSDASSPKSPSNPLLHPLLIVAICTFLISIALIFAGLVGHLGRILLGPPPIPMEKVRKRRGQLIILGVLLSLLIVGGLTTLPLTNILVQSAHILCLGGCK